MSIIFKNICFSLFRSRMERHALDLKSGFHQLENTADASLHGGSWKTNDGNPEKEDKGKQQYENLYTHSFP